MRGEPFLYPGAVTALIRDYIERAKRGEAAPEDPLTQRELQVVKLIAEGQTSDEIADLARDQPQDGRPPPRPDSRQARDAQRRRADALCDPPRPDRAVDYQIGTSTHTRASRRRVFSVWLAGDDATHCEPVGAWPQPARGTATNWARPTLIGMERAALIGMARATMASGVRRTLNEAAHKLSYGPGRCPQPAPKHGKAAASATRMSATSSPMPARSCSRLARSGSCTATSGRARSTPSR